jgi:hypothetical protein
LEFDKPWRRTGYFGHTPVDTYTQDSDHLVPVIGPRIVLLDTAAALVANGRLTAFCHDNASYPPGRHQRQTGRSPVIHLPSHTLKVAIVHPQIAPNTGNIARLCVATGTELHLVRPMGFVLADREIRRSAMDYWPRLRSSRA